MRVLVTSARSKLSRAIASALAWKHQVRLTDTVDAAAEVEFIRCDLGHDGAVNELVRGMDVIIHNGSVDLGTSPSGQLDYHARCTYNLLTAASDAGVPRVVYLSSLSVVARYSPEMQVTECWQPAPYSDVKSLGCHLGEFVCREFAREGRMTVVCLRLGEVVGNRRQAGPMALLEKDAVQAVDCALAADLTGPHMDWPGPRPFLKWGVFHIQSRVPDARFSTAAAERILGYKPTSLAGMRR